MQKLRYSFSLLFIICSTIAYSQFTVSGKIIDAESKEPLNSASVYCQNTTIGTTTNKQGEFSLQLKSGGYELVISYTGYQTKQVQ
ncbi:MAG TPA: carboxypeptidase-like regulatory domain-containing protein, partial [Chitinophagaceae bacterium]|nr:carboxypeptidase-like regulatory domain-containing protein [Chitinophagaceae bacterium]